MNLTPTSRLSFARAMRVARIAALLTGALGAIAFASGVLERAGSAFHFASFSNVHPNAAASFLLGALGVLLLLPLRGPLPQRVGAVLVAAVAAMGIVTYGQDLLGVDLGIDRWLELPRPVSAAAVPAARMPPVLSLGLFAVGVGLLLARGGSRLERTLSELLALGVLALAMVVLVGHLYGVAGLFLLGGAFPVPVPAAVALAFFAVAALFTSPSLGIARRFTEDSAGGLALRRLLPAALLVPVLIGLATQVLTRDGGTARDAMLALYSVAVALMFMTVVLSTDAAMRSLEAQRSDAEQRFRRTFENATVGIAHVTPDGRWLRVNQRLCDMVGRPRAELEALGFAELLHPQDRERHEEQESRLRDGDVAQVEAVERLLGRDGGTVWVDLRASPQLDDQGRVEYLIYVLLDVTERVQAQAERERLYHDAVEARAEAERANRAKDEFFALVSHELRAPLHTLTSWLSVLRGATDPALRARALRTVERASRAQARLINDLLDASRIQSGKLELAEEPFDARAVVAATVESMLPAASVRNVRLVTRLGEGPFVVRGDGERIEQVVRNLLDNALKFTNAGGRIEVGLRHLEDRLSLEVSDDGAGIEPAALPLVFERFHQGQAGGGHGGLGLGLSIVKHIVERHGGEVAVESAGLGKGATFRVILPLAGQEEAAALHEARVLPRPADETALRGVDVLLVDNDRNSLDALELLMQSAGATVRSVTTVKDALAVVEARRPDALLSDLHMQGYGGMHLVRELRTQEAGGANRVFALAMTSESGRATRDRALGAGFDDFLAKPIDPDLLCERLREGTSADSDGSSESSKQSPEPPLRRVLVVEDDPASLEATTALLAADSRLVLSAACGKDALRLAIETPPDLLVTDYRLPDMTGAQLAGALAASSGRPVTAVALTGYSTDDLGEDALVFARILRKPVAIAELEAALRLLG